MAIRCFLGVRLFKYLALPCGAHRISWFTRNSSGDEIANVNLFYDDIVHALQNTIDSCINSFADRRGYIVESRFTKFSEITQYNGLYAIQGHRFWYQSKAHIRLPLSD